VFQLVEKRRWYFLFSGLVILLGLSVMLYSTITTGAPFKMGVDFTGGSIWVIQFDQPLAPAELKAALATAGYADADVTTVGTANTLQVRLRPIDAVEQAKIATALQAAFPGVAVDTLQFSSVGPAIGSEVTRAALFAVAAASVVILGFMVVAFRRVPSPLRFGATAIVAMLHDILVALTFFSIMSLLFGWRADSLILTALLTVMSFSMQDKIVVFDRIRENLPKYRGESFTTVANRSILETIHRSLATQLNAIFIMVAILLFGGATIKQFIATMLVGLVSGTYSSIFIAVPLLVAWFERDLLGRKTDKPLDASTKPSLVS
jgi:preprotein translocase SecF subunit